MLKQEIELKEKIELAEKIEKIKAEIILEQHMRYVSLERLIENIFHKLQTKMTTQENTNVPKFQKKQNNVNTSLMSNDIQISDDMPEMNL